MCIDACNKNIETILLWTLPDGTNRPCGYFTELLIDTEPVYNATHRERLDLVWPVLLLQLYLERCLFTIQIDQDVLKWTLNLADLSSKIVRWRLRLSQIEFDVLHSTYIKPSN